MLNDPSPYLRPCPNCGVEMPTSCKICWHCGAYLDPRLREIAIHSEEAKT